jgi:hypothetical protein
MADIFRACHLADTALDFLLAPIPDITGRSPQHVIILSGNQGNYSALPLSYLCPSHIMWYRRSGHLIPIIQECVYETSLFSRKRNDCSIRALVCRWYRGRHRLFACNRFFKHFRVISFPKSASASSPPWLARHLF